MSSHARPNVLWISTHDINPHLGTYAGVWPGADAANTPHLDALAAEGVRFDRAMAVAPVCAPSRSSIMTGCFPTSIGTHNMRSKAVPPPHVRLLSEYFRAEGYYTTNNVFTDFQVAVPNTAFDDCSPEAHWRNRPTGAPFFAAFHGMVTHESQIYLSDEDFAKATASLDVHHDPEATVVPPYHPDTPTFRRHWARYHDLISVMDAWVGRLLAELDEDGLTRDTIVVFWSDHGAGFPRAKRWASEAGLRVPLIVRWPARIARPRVRNDVVHLADVAPSVLTMAGLPVPPHMQTHPLFDRDGVDVLQGRYAFGARDRMDEQRDASRTVRDERYRLIRHLHPDRPAMGLQIYAEPFATWQEVRALTADETRQRAAGDLPDRFTPLQRRVLTAESKPSEELYDVEADPHETRDLADDPLHEAARRRLSAALDQWISRVGDLGDVPEEELEERWRPSGRTLQTSAPTLRWIGDAVEVACDTEGALIEWTDERPVPGTGSDELSAMQRVSGAPRSDDRMWRLYTVPLVESPVPRWARAWRIGYDPSDVVHIPASPLVESRRPELDALLIVRPLRSR